MGINGLLWANGECRQSRYCSRRVWRLPIAIQRNVKNDFDRQPTVKECQGPCGQYHSFSPIIPNSHNSFTPCRIFSSIKAGQSFSRLINDFPCFLHFPSPRWLSFAACPLMKSSPPFDLLSFFGIYFVLSSSSREVIAGASPISLLFNSPWP